MKKADFNALIEYPVIAAVKDDEGLFCCLKTECRFVFVLYGTILNIKDIVKKIKDAGKIAIVHIDFIGGLSQKDIAVDYLKEITDLDGIISTKPQLVKHAKEIGLYGVQRFFLVDSIAVNTVKKHIELYKPDLIEVMPGVIPKIIKEISEFTDVPIIAGGLLRDKDDVFAALNGGACAVSSTRQSLWNI